MRRAGPAARAHRWPTGGGNLTLISSAPGTVTDLRALPTGVYPVRSLARGGLVVKRLVKE